MYSVHFQGKTLAAFVHKYLQVEFDKKNKEDNRI